MTHKPYPNIRRFNQETHEFQKSSDESIRDEQTQVEEEMNEECLKRIIGTWIHVDENQAIWRATSACQRPFKSLPCLRTGQVRKKHGAGLAERLPQRPVEVVYIKKRGKVIVDGPEDAAEAVLRALKPFTRPDDNAVMPIDDLKKTAFI